MTPELLIIVFLFVLMTIFEWFIFDSLWTRIKWLEDEHDLHNNDILDLQEDVKELRRRNQKGD